MLAESRTRKHAARSSVAAVHSIDRVVCSVPDLDVAATFFDAFGLEGDRRGDRLDLRTRGDPRPWLTLHRGGERKKLEILRFGCFAEDFDAIAARVQASTFGTQEPHPLGDGSGIWARHPDGYAVQIVVAPKRAPDAKSPLHEPVAVPTGSGRAPNRAEVAKVHPRRLSHALLFSPDVARAIDFFEQVPGLRVTDRSGDIVVFMHGAHGSDHHLIGITLSNAGGLHHTSWDVASLDEVGLGMEQMLRAGHPRGWGVGRHVLGSNYFYYARDPWGSYAEYSYDIDFVPGDFDWQMRDHPPEDSFYVWGPQVPADFGTNFEVPQAEETR